MKLPICLLLFVMVTIDYGNACSCRPGFTIQDKFCKSDFVVLVKVLDSGRVYGMNRVYSINLITTYKSNVYGSIDVRRIYTATSSAACGVILQKGYYYVLTGKTRVLSVQQVYENRACFILKMQMCLTRKVYTLAITEGIVEVERCVQDYVMFDRGTGITHTDYTNRTNVTETLISWITAK